MQKLKTLAFEALYVCPDLPPEVSSYLAPGEARVTRVPQGFYDDLQGVLDILGSIGGKHQQFPLPHDGQTYSALKVPSEDGRSWFMLRRATDVFLQLPETGMPLRLCKIFRSFAPKAGLILVSSRTKGGKTALAYSLFMDALMSQGGMGATVENMISVRIGGEQGPDSQGWRCYQSVVRDVQHMPAFIQRAVDVRARFILVDKLRDPQSALAAVRAAIGGSLVVATIDASNVISAIGNLISLVKKTDEVTAMSDLASALAAAVHQEYKPTLSGQNQAPPTHQFLLINKQEIRDRIRSEHIELLKADVQTQANILAQSIEKDRQEGQGAAGAAG